MQTCVQADAFGPPRPVTRRPPGIVSGWRGRKPLGTAARILGHLPASTPLLDLFGGSGIVTLLAAPRRRWWNDHDPALEGRPAVVSGWLESTGAPDHWELHTLPETSGRKAVRTQCGDGFRTDALWVSHGSPPG